MPGEHEVQQNNFPSPEESVNGWLQTASVGLVIVALGTIWLPMYPLLSAGIGGLTVMCFLVSVGLKRRYVREREELISCRRFLNEDGRGGRGDEPDGRWAMPGPPVSVRAEQHTIVTADGTMEEQRLWVKRLLPEWRKRVEELGTYLTNKQAHLASLVQDWYQYEVLAPIVGELFPGRSWADLTPAHQAQCQEMGAADYYEGVCVALRPSTWHRRDDMRPSQRRLTRLRRRLRKAYPDGLTLTDAPTLWHPHHDTVYLGRGFRWEGRHAEGIYQESFRSLSSLLKISVSPLVTIVAASGLTLAGLAAALYPLYQHIWFAVFITAVCLAPAVAWVIRWFQVRNLPPKEVDGDPRTYAQGFKEVQDVTLSQDKLRQHGIFLGRTGTGKTRGGDTLLIHAIRNGDPVFVLDPKPDEQFINLVVETARACGRGNDVKVVSLIDAMHPEIATINPLENCINPSDIGGRLAAITPDDSHNRFWRDAAIGIGRNMGVMCHYINAYLTALSGGQRYANRAPKLLCWLHYAHLRVINGRDGVARKAAQAEFDILFAKLQDQDKNYTPQDAVETEVRRLFLCKEFSAKYWVPSYYLLRVYAVQEPQRLVSWAVRIVYFHLMADYPAYADIESPLSDSRQSVTVSTEERIATIDLWTKQRVHPCDERSMVLGRTYLEPWVDLYTCMLDAKTLHQVKEVSHSVASNLDLVIPLARMDTTDYEKRVSSIVEPLNLLSTEGKLRLFSSPDPTVTVHETVSESGITVLSLGQMIDVTSSDAAAKSFVQALLAYLGEVLIRTPDNPKTLWWFGDELPSWGTPETADVLDKARAAGIIAMLFGQDMAGARAKIRNGDLIKHILNNLGHVFQFGTNSEEDATLFGKLAGQVPIISHSRSITRSPAFGDAGARLTSLFNASEQHTFSDKNLPAVTLDVLSSLPKGQAFYSQLGRLWIMQVGLVPKPETDYWAEIGVKAEGLRDGKILHFEDVQWIVPRHDPDEDDDDQNASPPTDTVQEQVEQPAPVVVAEEVGADEELRGDQPIPLSALISPRARQQVEDDAANTPDEASEASKTATTTTATESTDGDTTGTTTDTGGPAPAPIQSQVVSERGFTERGPLVNGVRHGHWRIYDPAGHLASQGLYKHGSREGEWTAHGPDGSVFAILTYKEHEMVDWRSAKPAARDQEQFA